LQLEVYIDCNSNHCPIATKGVVQFQAEAFGICNSECTSIASRTTDVAEAACEVASLQHTHTPPPAAAWEAAGLRPYASADNSYNAYVSSIVGFFSTKPGPQFATRIVIQMQLLQLNKAPQLQLDKALQLQLRRHYGSNSANASIATSRALQLQLWTCNFYNLYQTNCNSTSTLVATRQALQLQLFKNHFNCNSTRTPVGTPQTLQQLLDHFGCNSEHVIFIR
jgi:hypothetical protein